MNSKSFTSHFERPLDLLMLQLARRLDHSGALVLARVHVAEDLEHLCHAWRVARQFGDLEIENWR